MVEPKRKHGPFDRRYPMLATLAAPTWVLQVIQGLDRTAVLTRFYPNRRRHDLEALAAYGRYRNGPKQRPSDRRAETGSSVSPPGRRTRRPSVLPASA